MSEQKNTTLLDLLYAFARLIKHFCTWLKNLCSKMIRLTWRKWYITIPMIIIGFALSLWLTALERREYKTVGVLILNGPTDFEVKRSIDLLANATPEYLNPKTTLQAQLGLTDEQANGLGYFECFPVIDYRNDSVADAIDFKRKHNPADTLDVVMNNRLAVVFRTKNLQAIPDIENGLLNYLNNNPQHQASFEAKKKAVETQAEFCRTQIAMLDSFSTTYYFLQGTGMQAQLNPWREGTVIGRREIMPLHPHILGLMETQKKVDHELAHMTAPVAIESSFAGSPRPVWRRILVCPALTLAAWFLALLLAWAIEDRKELLAWLNSRS